MVANLLVDEVLYYAVVESTLLCPGKHPENLCYVSSDQGKVLLGHGLPTHLRPLELKSLTQRIRLRPHDWRIHAFDAMH